jgi:hypothetical protein
MTLNSKSLAAALFVLLFGGIMLSSALGWWQTTTDKTPAAYAEGEFAGQANPADIRGSYTFGDIANSFNVAPEVLAQAFGVTDENPAAFQVKLLEEIYADSPVEIGTGSVRIFVAFYVGLPYDLAAAEETYLPQSAADILNAQGKLTPEQKTWLDAHIVPAAGEAPATVAPSAPSVEVTPTASAAAEESEYLVKGKTTFGELISWGVSQEVIEALIGAPMPDPAMTVKDFAAANGLNFETLKPALQAEVDKAKK